MPNKNYQRGVRFERKLMEEFKDEIGIKKGLTGKNGFVIRASGSHGKFDVVSVNYKKKEVKFFQCKVKKGKGPRVYISWDDSGEYEVDFTKVTEYVK